MDKLNLGVHILGEADSWMLFGPNGMERNKRVKLDKGVKIYGEWGQCYSDSCTLVIYDDNMNAVKIYDGNEPEKIEEWELESINPFHKVDETARPISQKFGIGTYYADSEPLIDEAVIEKSLIHANLLVKAQEEHKANVIAEKNRKFREDKEAYKKRYPYLEENTSTDYRNEYKNTVSNVRAMLKKEFPGVKFSVRKTYQSSTDSLTIGWEDGPTEREVTDVLKVFENAFTGDVMTDYFEYGHTNFTAIYGGFDYMHYKRSMSDDTRILCENHINGFKQSNGEWDVIALEEEVNDYPTNYTNWSLRDMAWWYFRRKSFYHKTETGAKGTENVVGNFQIIDYSEKAIAVCGDTKAIKDELKSIGGRFNPRLSCGAGWIFPKSKREQLVSVLTAKA